MSSSNNRTINGYETIDGELVLSEITNSVLATDSDGLVYGINNYISNLTSDVQTQINTINTTLTNKENLLTAANKLDMAYETLGDGPVRHSGPVHPTLSSNNILSIFFSKLS